MDACRGYSTYLDIDYLLTFEKLYNEYINYHDCFILAINLWKCTLSLNVSKQPMHICKSPHSGQKYAYESPGIYSEQ